MTKFRVMIVKKDGRPIGVRAAAINGRTIVLALRGFDAISVEGQKEI